MSTTLERLKRGDIFGSTGDDTGAQVETFFTLRPEKDYLAVCSLSF